MSHFTIDGFAALLERAHGGRAVIDTDEKGKTVLNFHVSNPRDARHSVSLTANSFRGGVTLCSLRFGQVEVSSALDPADAVPAIEAILSGQIVAVARYRNRAAYDDSRMATYGRAAWLYQLPDDAEAHGHMLKKLGRAANPWEKLIGTATGIYEVYDWQDSALYER